MGRAKKKPVSATSPVPEYIQQAPLLNKRKITKRKLPSYAEAMLLLHAPEMLRLFFEASFAAIKAGDKDIIKMTAEMFDYIKKNGLTINQNILQNNAAAGPESPVKGFDAFARELAEARAGHVLPPPTVIEGAIVHPADTPAPAEG